MRVLTCLTQEHNLLLVLLAAIICVVGSVVLNRLFDKNRRSDPKGRLPWMFLGAMAGGATIWCTHFVAMLAYRPGVEVAYAPMLTGASLLVAMAAVVWPSASARCADGTPPPRAGPCSVWA